MKRVHGNRQRSQHENTVAAVFRPARVPWDSRGLERGPQCGIHAVAYRHLVMVRPARIPESLDVHHEDGQVNCGLASTQHPYQARGRGPGLYRSVAETVTDAPRGDATSRRIPAVWWCRLSRARGGPRSRRRNPPTLHCGPEPGRRSRAPLGGQGQAPRSPSAPPPGALPHRWRPPHPAFPRFSSFPLSVSKQTQRWAVDPPPGPVDCP